MIILTFKKSLLFWELERKRTLLSFNKLYKITVILKNNFSNLSLYSSQHNFNKKYKKINFIDKTKR